MNGATALPLERMTRPPKTAIMTMIGISQYFRRTRMKLQSSAMKSINMRLSELSRHSGRLRARRRTLDPVRGRVRVEPKPKRILAHRPHDQRDRRHGREEEQGHHDRVDHGVQQQPELGP